MPINNNAVAIDSPLPGKHHIVPPGGLGVKGEAGANVDHVWVKIRRLADNTPLPTNATDAAAAGWTSTPVMDNGTRSFSINNLSGTVTKPISGDADNKVTAIPQLDNGDFNVADADMVSYIGRPALEEEVVTAKQCIWFTFADDDLPGLGPENDREANTRDHKPVKFKVPANAGGLTINASGRWRHYFPVNGNDNAVAGPDGRGETVVLQMPGYRSEFYGSDEITLIGPTNVASLIGLWVDATPEAIGAPFSIGSIFPQSPIPGTAEELSLAFHDGKRWHNNSGKVLVELNWTLATNYLQLRTNLILPRRP